jgi:alkanesulfonate monooxygenase SsuD/methylene tetrahydromethanopterin reductase-like flavin-dependent oxidoreductase (luciferase family)
MRVGYAAIMQNYQDWERIDAQDFSRPPTLPDATMYDGEVQLASQVEDLGFDSMFTVEHHFSPYTIIPDPIQFLTFMAGRTTRIDFGTMVIVLPWHDPVLVAEKIALFDTLLAGRGLTIGFGRGLARTEYEGLRIDQTNSRELFNEALEVIRLALGQERFSFDGKHFQVPPISLRPRPRDAQRLLDSMYCAWGSPETIGIAAELDLLPMFIPQKPWEMIRKEVRHYNGLLAAKDKPPVQPIVACQVFCHENESEAAEHARTYMAQYQDSGGRHYQLLNHEHFDKVGGYDYYAKMAKQFWANPDPDMAAAHLNTWVEGQVWGTPEQCVERMRHIQQMTGAREVVGCFRYGAMPVELAENSLRLFGQEVVPAVHAFEAAPALEPVG